MTSTRNVFTIGHSTMAAGAFITLLRDDRVAVVVDIRTIPRSRHNPQFESKALEKSLRESGIDYVWMRGLGGLRRPLTNSRNLGWRNASFRGFADYMQTHEFHENLEKLIEIISTRQAAVMCAEAVPWRCHRSLLADALLVRGFEVKHIIGRSPPRPHSLTRFAKVVGGEITYPEAIHE